jgi:hypothetical protein
MRLSIMLRCITRFLDRTAEMERLDRLASREGGGPVVLYGPRPF